MIKRIAILGSTGSIGTQSLNVVRHLQEKFEIVGLAAYGNQLDLLEEQIQEFSPKMVSVFDPEKALALEKKNLKAPIYAGIEGLIEIVTNSHVDLVIFAMQGTQALLAAEKAILAKKNIALANKELLVAAGEILTKLAKENHVDLLPIDSEMSAIFQCLVGEDQQSIKRVILTASGGPFYKNPPEDLKKITLQDALKHPTWSMGKQVSVDCSTLMNKGFEVIETKWLFDLPLEKIDVVVHPQSLVHSFVEFQDGSLKASIGEPNMELYIQYALTYPKRFYANIENFNFSRYGTWEFFEPDYNRFRCLGLAYNSIKAGGSTPCALHAANEVFVEKFCDNHLYWCQIGEKLELFLNKYIAPQVSDIQDILSVNEDAREFAKHMK